MASQQWSYVNGRFVSNALSAVRLPASIRTPTGAATSAVSAVATSHPVSGTILDGEFVEIESLSAFSTNPRVVPAAARSPVVLGLASATTTRTTNVKHQGVGMAWVIQGNPSPPLSGFYAKSVNGIHTANVVVDVQGESFTISATKSKELDTLTARFDALTST